MKLALTLPIVIASIERAFSTMNNNKILLHNKMRDEYVNDVLVIYIEKKSFDSSNDKSIVICF